MNNDKPLVIYHGNCADGFGAAWCFHHQNPGAFNFHAGVYQNPPPDIEHGTVYLVDFSYKRSVVEELLKKNNRIILIDHHKTAIEDLQPLIDDKSIQAYVDVNRSGARLAWDYLFGREEDCSEAMPKLIAHIEDRDLWRFNLPGTENIQATIFSYPYDFDVWTKLMLDYHPDDLEIEGQAITRKHHKDIAELINVTTHWMLIYGYLVPVANLPYTLTSDAGHALFKKYDAPFAGCYWDTPDGRVFSLRSEDSRVDVSEIAKVFGGGGHRNASGFRVPYNKLVWTHIPDGVFSDLNPGGKQTVHK